MKTSQSGINLIKRHEGLRTTAYRCPAGVLTIGYGHTGADVFAGKRITEQEAERLLVADLITAETAVNQASQRLNQNQFDALVSFTFNIGTGAFRSSTLLRLVRENPNNFQIRNEFKRWNKGGGMCLPGLAMRRNDEADLYFSK